MKRILDLVGAICASLILAPLAIVLAVLTFLQDGNSPFYVGRRVGRGGKDFGMVKFRTMVRNADRSGVMSTAEDDLRITRLGHLMRRFKLDELPQLYNILRGDMSFVGPRPNVLSEVKLYSEVECELLSVRPGLTDFASIVFSDEGTILKGSTNPDRDYNLLIRPWKNRLGLHYICVRTVVVDVRLIWLTALAVFSKRRALEGVEQLLVETQANEELVRVSRREEPLKATLPPGVTEETWEKHLTYA